MIDNISYSNSALDSWDYYELPVMKKQLVPRPGIKTLLIYGNWFCYNADLVWELTPNCKKVFFRKQDPELSRQFVLARKMIEFVRSEIPHSLNFLSRSCHLREVERNIQALDVMPLVRYDSESESLDYLDLAKTDRSKERPTIYFPFLPYARKSVTLLRQITDAMTIYALSQLSTDEFLENYKGCMPVGNCREMAILAYLYARQHLGVTNIAVCGIGNGDHVFTVFNGVVCDPWSGAYYPFSELCQHLNDHIIDVGSFRTKVIPFDPGKQYIYDYGFYRPS